jgi:putative tryptophan/tyrosine transport system substrate-binding protein
MRRRNIVASVCAILAWPVIGIAQQGRSQRRIGVLNPESTSLAPLLAFLEELRALGWRDRENASIDIRSADGRYELVSKLAAELVRARPEVIYTLGPDATLAAAAATKTLPIVAIDLESDPISAGLDENLARPGRNVTGLFLDLPELAGKWLEYLGETVPQLTHVGVLGTARINRAQFAAVEKAASVASCQLHKLNIDDARALEGAFETAARERVQGVVILPSPLILDNRVRIASLALEKGLPTVFLFAQAAEAGGMIAYGPSVNDMSRRAARLVMKVLNGAQPSDLPIERPTQFELVINMNTARMLGLTVPVHLQQLADMVIE